MSYDVVVGNCTLNYTWNMGPFFRDHIQWVDSDMNLKKGIQALDGLTGKEASMVLSQAFINIQTTSFEGEKKMLDQYNSPNGWGSVIGAMIFMANILSACAASPNKKVRVL